MRTGCSPRKYLPVLSAIAVGAAAASAPAATAASSSSASRLAERVASATDRQLVIAIRPQITPSYAELTYSNAAKEISVEFLGKQLYSGDIKGRRFERTAKSCYSTTKERFVGLSTIGDSLLPQGAGSRDVIGCETRRSIHRAGVLDRVRRRARRGSGRLPVHYNCPCI